MKIGLISDAHGNPIALDACLRKIDELNLQEIYFLGDAVGYFPGEAEVIQQLRQRDVPCQLGNHEAMLLGSLPFSAERERVYRINDARARLSQRDWEAIRRWPDHRLVHFGHRKVLLVHASPFNFLCDRVFAESDFSRFSTLDCDAVFMGHTHRPFIRMAGRMLVVNVGSCGMPRDQGDLAGFAVYDTDSNACEILRVRFEPKEVVTHFRGIDIPGPVLQCMQRTCVDCFGRII
jgi:putative phosphoesterase